MAMSSSGTNSASRLRESVDLFDPRRYDKALPATTIFPQQRLAQTDGVEWLDHGSYWLAPRRRGRDHADLGDADERDLEGARYRRRSHRQHVQIVAELPHCLLMAGPKALLLVNNQQAKVVEPHAFRQ